MAAHLDPAQAAERAERNEIAAWHDMFAAIPAELAQAHGMAAQRRGGTLALSVRDLPIGMFNRAFGLGLDEPLDADTLAWAEAAVPSAQRWLQPAPNGREADSTARLDAAGYQRRPQRWAQFLRAAEPLAAPPDSPEVRAVPPERAGDFARTLIQAMGLPGWMVPWCAALCGRPRWHTFAAYADGVPIGAAALFIEGDNAWLGMAATLPVQRRRGGQRALLAHRIGTAAARGARWVSSETGEPMPGQPHPSYDNLLASGLVVQAHRQVWSR
jgi:GNAT superfamily N-acetyltransferase